MKCERCTASRSILIKAADRIDELEAIIREAFVVWNKDDNTQILSFNRMELSDDTGAAIIAICQPSEDNAPPGERHV